MSKLGIEVCRPELSTTPTYTIRRTNSGLHDLTIEGRFRHPHWVATLLSGLASRGVSVVSGRASSPAGGRWSASFRLDSSRSSLSPDRIDYLALAESESRHATQPPPVIGGYTIRRRGDHLLEVDVHGPDQLGFLGGLLGALSLLMLFPSELLVDTIDGHIRDTIVLRAMGGRVPSDATRGSLETLLNGLSCAAA